MMEEMREEVCVYAPRNDERFTVFWLEDDKIRSQSFMCPKVQARRLYAYPVLAIGIPVVVVADVVVIFMLYAAVGISTM